MKWNVIIWKKKVKIGKLIKKKKDLKIIYILYI